MSAPDIISGDPAVATATLDDINAALDDINTALGDIRIVLDDIYSVYDDLRTVLIVIIIMLGIIAGACIFRHLRK